MLSTLSVLDNPPSISAEELHEILIVAYAGGNVARKRFIDALRAMYESRLYFQLGFPDIAAYADATFRYSRSQAYELLRVSKALVELPKIAGAFERGEISWSLVLGLSRVADETTEAEWLQMIQDRPVRAVLHELRDARKKGRNRPRRDGFGLSGLPVKLRFELSPEEHAVFVAGLKKVSKEMGESLDGALPRPKEALLYLLRRVLETEPEECVTEGRKEKDDSPFAVIFHRCPECRRSAVECAVGRVEVSEDAMDRIEASAERVVIQEDAAPSEPIAAEERDRPNTPAIRRALRLREGGRCANPFCMRETGPEGHAHHIRFRSKGGRTELSNEVWCCVRCHACIHAGSLAVESNGIGGLKFRPVSDESTCAFRESLDRIARVPDVRSVEVARESTRMDSIRENTIDDEAASHVFGALLGLGWTPREASRLRERARASLSSTLGASEALDESRWLREACRLG